MTAKDLRAVVAAAVLLAAGACASWGFNVEDDETGAKEGHVMGDEQAAAAWLEGFVGRYRPLYKDSALAWWNASITGRDEDYKKRLDLDMQMDRLFADRESFAALKKWRDGGKIAEPLLRRQVEILYLAHLAKQVNTKLLDRMTELANQVDQIFNTFRPEIGGKKHTENEVRKILRESTKNPEVEAAWKAYQAVGKFVEPKLRELVKLRNESAREVGFANFHALQLATQEFDGGELLSLFDQLDRDTAGVFKSLKVEVDEAMAKRFGVGAADLRPWNYQDLFFQEAPRIYPVDLDRFYKDRKIDEIGKKFYDGIGLGVGDILARSDLYEKPGKSPHAFCADMDREGDVRTLQNLVPNEQWMGTLLHELGHGVYSKYIDRSLPYVLRDSAHIFATEGVAMFFGRQSKDAAWLQDNLGIPEADVKPVADSAGRMLRLEQIIFSRWTQVMLRFEKAMYEDPGQDLNKLWWNLKARYQLLAPDPGRSEPDYAAKIHIVSVPVYYHNYMLGELFASQLYAKIGAVRSVKAGEPLRLSRDKVVGAFFKEKVFAPGMAKPWREFVEAATGEPLSARAFAGQFIQGNEK
ncbi:MAG: M2 family metallopeptidase [Deltaproteobacteria bacterium]|nr:M2 family metallopeptidase [Deltaproteobacteria bacterium]